MIGRWNSGDDRSFEQRRQEMIDQTSAFLTWALENGVDVPRIPRRPVDEGGFTQLLKLRGAREMVNRWWWRTLDIIESSERR